MKTAIEVILLDIKSFSESSLWVCFYSKEHGIQNGIIKGGKKKKTKALVLGLYFFTLYRPNNDKLQSIIEIERSCSLDAVYSSPIKILVAFFMADSYRSVLGDSGADSSLFELAKKQILTLNNTSNVHSFPLLFLAQLISFLGYKPLKSELLPIHEAKGRNGPLEIIDTALLLFDQRPDESVVVKENKAVFDLIVSYSRHHIPGYRVDKSVDVIREVLYD